MTKRQLKKWQKARRRSNAIRKAANIARRNQPKERDPLPMVKNSAGASWMARLFAAVMRHKRVAGIVLFCLWLAGCTPIY